MKALLIAAMLVLASCGLNATTAGVEKIIEVKVDLYIDEFIDRMCKGPVDVAVRTFKNHPALYAAAIVECPDSYGWLALQVRAADARKDAITDAVREAIRTPGL